MAKTTGKSVRTKGQQTDSRRPLETKSLEPTKVKGPKPIGVETKWFKSRIEAAGISMRKLAARMQMDVSAVSLMLNGKRSMDVAEAAELAVHLHVPVEEILRRAGATTTPLPVTADAVPVVGWVDAAGSVHEERPLGPGLVVGPVRDITGLKAIRAQTGGMFDGWLFFFRDANDLAPDAVGRLCVVRLAGVDGLRLRWIQRGYHEGHWTLLGACQGSAQTAPESKRAAF